MQYCNIELCENFKKVPTPSGIQCFRIPLDPNLRQSWLNEIRMHQNISAHGLVCQLHFEKRYLSSHGDKITLTKDAVPTIFKTSSVRRNLDDDNPMKIKPVLRTYSSKSKSNASNTVRLVPLTKVERTEPKVVPLDDGPNSIAPSEPPPKPKDPQKCVKCIHDNVYLQGLKAKVERMEKFYSDLRSEADELKKQVGNMATNQSTKKCPKYNATVDGNERICNDVPGNSQESDEPKPPLTNDRNQAQTFAGFQVKTYTNKMQTKKANINVDKLYQCGICNESFETGKILLKHKQIQHDKPNAFYVNRNLKR